MPITWVGKVNSFLDSAVQNPLLQHPIYWCIPDRRPVSRNRRSFRPLPSKSSLVGNQQHQDGGLLKTSHVTSGFPRWDRAVRSGTRFTCREMGVSSSNLASQLASEAWATSARRSEDCSFPVALPVTNHRALYFAGPPLGGGEAVMSSQLGVIVT